MTFTPEVYEEIREGARRSADVIVPRVYELFKPRTVVDVGAGEGWFARAFARSGCAVIALDESVTGDRVEYTDNGGSVLFHHADLLDGDAWAYSANEADLAVCLEVAEHLTPGAADAFLGTLCALSPLVLFSAAVPGQGGHGHLNEQWPAYWVDRFEKHGFEVSGALRWELWGNPDVEPWYQQNVLVAAHRARVRAQLPNIAHYGMGELFVHTFHAPVSIVHPTTFTHITTTWRETAKALDARLTEANFAIESLLSIAERQRAGVSVSSAHFESARDSARKAAGL